MKETLLKTDEDKEVGDNQILSDLQPVLLVFEFPKGFFLGFPKNNSLADLQG